MTRVYAPRKNTHPLRPNRPPDPKQDKQVIAITCSDVHLSHAPPLARSAEPDWYAAQKRPLDELRELMIKHKCPLIIAGDIFDRWNPPLELVNKALVDLPPAFCVVGQHDLPHHRYEDIKKSAYWNLVEHGKIRNLEPGKPMAVDNMVLWGFPYGFPVTPCDKPIKEFCVNVAVVHAYLWTKTTGYPGADPAKRLKACRKNFQGYEAVVVGDNHRGFLNGRVCNNGTLMRRKADERDYVPQVGLIHADGSISRTSLDCSKDRFLEPEELASAVTAGLDLSDFIETLEGMGDAALDVDEMVSRCLEKMKASETVKTAVLKAFSKDTNE